ncbi:MAG: hypothetical protein U1A05_02405, partial [Alphaproteobacteria bacterium]|nr:hypothetical protein [Alphaproteobacteria bacterium]
MSRDVESPSVMTPLQVDEIFELGNREIIEKMIMSRLDLGHALRSAVKMAKEPTLSDISSLKGDNYYWYDLVDRILEKNLPAKDIDIAIYIALNNSKTTLLARLLKG